VVGERWSWRRQRRLAEKMGSQVSGRMEATQQHNCHLQHWLIDWQTGRLSNPTNKKKIIIEDDLFNCYCCMPWGKELSSSLPCEHSSLYQKSLSVAPLSCCLTLPCLAVFVPWRYFHMNEVEVSIYLHIPIIIIIIIIIIILYNLGPLFL